MEGNSITSWYLKTLSCGFYACFQGWPSGTGQLLVSHPWRRSPPASRCPQLFIGFWVVLKFLCLSPSTLSYPLVSSVFSSLRPCCWDLIDVTSKISERHNFTVNPHTDPLSLKIYPSHLLRCSLGNEYQTVFRYIQMVVVFASALCLLLGEISMQIEQVILSIIHLCLTIYACNSN